MKILPVGIEFHAERQADRRAPEFDEALMRFSQFCERT